MTNNLVQWIKTTGIAVIGGGVAGAFAAAMDPLKYVFPHDFGSGKLWKYFFMGAGLTLGGLLLKSPIGQKTMAAFKDSQTQLQQSQADLAQAKSDLKESVKQPEPPKQSVPPKSTT